jgi:STAS-like domain of unknown function (DUF4325)
VVIKVLEVVSNCNSFEDGDKLQERLRLAFSESDREITISFEGVDDVPSAFVNAAFLPLLDLYNFEDIRRRLRVVNSTRQINDLIKRRLTFEASARSASSPLADIKRKA